MYNKAWKPFVLEVTWTAPAMQLPLLMRVCVCVWTWSRPLCETCYLAASCQPYYSALCLQQSEYLDFGWHFGTVSPQTQLSSLRVSAGGQASNGFSGDWSHHWGIFGWLHHACLCLLIKNRGNELWQCCYFTKKIRIEDIKAAMFATSGIVLIQCKRRETRAIPREVGVLQHPLLVAALHSKKVSTQ